MTVKTYTTAQMRDAELRAVSEYGITLERLMKNAGKQLARAAVDMLDVDSRPVAVFCGKGNNGGDGYVCAAELLKMKYEATVWAIDRSSLEPGSLAGNAADAFERVGGFVRPITPELTPGDIGDCALIIDAVFGTGLARGVTGIAAHAIGLINAVPSRVLSCDVPSGVDADTGRIMGVAVMADRTLMLGLAKAAYEMPPGSGCFGDALVADIGLPADLIDSLG